MKKLKIREDIFQEIIDSDGSLISGGLSNSNEYIKTNQYRDSGRPETTEDFADATSQDSKWYLSYRGFSVSESVNESTIPDITSLSRSYDVPEIQSNLSQLLSGMSRLDVNKNDINAIIVKEILRYVNFNDLDDEHVQEIKSMVNGK